MAWLDTPEGREALLEKVWGPPDTRDRARQLLKVGGSVAAFGYLLKAAIYMPFTRVVLVIAGCFAAAAVWWLVTLVWRRVQAHRNRLKPRGAKRARLQASSGLVGRVVGASTIVSAGSRSECLAYSVTLRADRHQRSDVMLRYADAAAFEIELDDGSRVEVPAGRLRLEGQVRTLPASRAGVRDQIPLPLVPEGEFDLVPFDLVDEVLLREGDTVSIHGELEREPLVSSQSAYRHTCWLYRPSTVVGLRIDHHDASSESEAPATTPP